MSLSTHFRAELEEEIEILENQKDAIRSEVTLLDTQLDRYDVIIENIDRDLVPLINEINVGINSVNGSVVLKVTITRHSSQVIMIGDFKTTMRKSWKLLTLIKTLITYRMTC